MSHPAYLALDVFVVLIEAEIVLGFDPGTKSHQRTHGSARTARSRTVTALREIIVRLAMVAVQRSEVGTSEGNRQIRFLRHRDLDTLSRLWFGAFWRGFLGGTLLVQLWRH